MLSLAREFKVKWDTIARIQRWQNYGMIDNRRRGERNKSARLTCNDVRVIRTEYQAGMVSLRGLAVRYGVSSSTVHNVLSGKNWEWVSV